MSDSEDDKLADSIERALQSGTVWLDPVFVFQNKTVRIFRRRVTTLEIVWALLASIVVALLLISLRFVFGDGGPFFFLFSPFAIAFWSLIAMVFGRRIAFMSPLRRQTGEGTGTWMTIMIRRMITRISWIFTRPVMYNYCNSRAGDPHLNMQRVECIEHLGTAHSPRAPYSPKDSDATHNEAVLRPRGRPIYNNSQIGDFLD